MATTLLGLLGVLICALAVSSEVLPQADFDVKGVAGKWYLIGFATNAEWFIARKANMKMGVAMLTPTDEGDLEMAYSSLNPDGTCWRMNHLAQKTDVPGKFTFQSERRTPDLSQDVLDKFTEFSLEQGILSENIAILPKNGECP
ncbi:Lipocalin precursor [Labeo rohita]|uniref:Lipocalin n=1 Tax=Labeo rohita TaxID=84645 RepID=A0A498L4J4_LABRO|nr:Lipocalin precursor [Labeo rohita]RXN31544.1 Lipocalin precursor [Labeo rohita]